MDITTRAHTLSQYGEDKRYEKAVKAHPYLEQLKLPAVCMVVGSSGSRKTSFMLSLLRDLQESARYFDVIILYSGAKDNNEQYAAFETKKTQVKTYNVFNSVMFDEFIRKFEAENFERREKKKKMLTCAVIFDDPVGLPGWVPGTTRNPSSVDRLCTTCRHFNMSLFYLVQRYRLMNMVMRCTNLTALVLMGVKPKELSQIAEEHAYEMVDDDAFVEIYNHVRSQGDGHFLVVNYKVPKHLRMQHNFVPIDVSGMSSEEETAKSSSSS